jgi:hypothetical protein
LAADVHYGLDGVVLHHLILLSLEKRRRSLRSLDRKGGKTGTQGSLKLPILLI